MAPETQSLKVSVGQDKWINLSGPSAFLTALVILLLIVVGYLVNFNLNVLAAKIDEHTFVMGTQHDDITLAIRWNTYVQRYCNANDMSATAKMKCSSVDLERPEPESNPARRRFHFKPSD